jgi:hypothetical protein
MCRSGHGVTRRFSAFILWGLLGHKRVNAAESQQERACLATRNCPALLTDVMVGLRAVTSKLNVAAEGPVSFSGLIGWFIPPGHPPLQPIQARTVSVSASFNLHFL